MVTSSITKREEEENKQWVLRLELRRRTTRLVALAAEREASKSSHTLF